MTSDLIYTLHLAETDAEIELCYPVMVQLRPHLTMTAFAAAVRHQQSEGYRLAYVETEGHAQAVAGFRFMEMLSRGKFMYVDDLVTRDTHRSRGYGAILFDWLIAYARAHGCERLNLDSGVQRFAAHRFYFRQGMHIAAYNFLLDLNPTS